ncbi:hypothetical protein [Chitinophaga sp. MM2321]|uniref:hypothetical protein n=1 Tax=Chitinophaga sp. MM2321 TaxID=3137178 RepID=UPI0032D5A3BE
MRAICTSIIMLFSATQVYAQQNSYPLLPGKVGIGTDAPTKLLDVRGDFRLGLTEGGTAYSIGFTRADAQLYGTTAAGLLLGGDGTGTDMNISPAGNVGIGVTNAGARLHVVNGQQQIMFATGTSSSGYTLNIGLNDDGVNFNNNSSQRGFNFSNQSGQLLTISNSGNVGIGTPHSTGYKLAVAGTIAGRKVKVTQETWADDVFHDDYALPSLQAVANFIRVNKHLPEIPSEKEVKADGLDLGEMNRLLLKKVEELTLYIIRLENNNLELNKRMEMLEQKH